VKRSVWFLLLIVLLGCDRAATPVWKWTLQSRCYAEPLIDGSRVVITSQAGEVVLGDLQTGKKVWSIKLESPIFGTPVISNGRLIVGTERGNLYSVNPTDGAIQWKYSSPASSFVSNLRAFGDTILVSNRSGALLAVNAPTGNLLWSNPDHKVFTASVAVQIPYAFIGGWDHFFHCIKIDTGETVWRYQIDEPIVQEAVVYRNNAVFSGHEHALWCLDISSGKLQWKLNASNPSNLMILEDQLFAGVRNNLLEINPNNGTVKRTFVMKKRIDHLYVHDGRLFALCGARLYQIDLQNARSELILTSPQPLFRIGFSPNLYVASDQTYDIWAFALK
jgi:outer membrane protein assembly factor BamB